MSAARLVGTAPPRVTPVLIDVVGLGEGGLADLAPGARELVASARVLLGGRRHLDLVPPVPGQIRHVWPSPLRAGLPALLDEVAREAAGTVVALASGDPLRSGIGTTLIDLVGAERVRVHPHVSSATLARARMGWPAEECTVVSLVGRDIDVVRRHLDPGARLVLLCSDGSTPTQVAALLTEQGCGQSVLTARWHLGGPREGTRSATASTWRGSTPDLVVLCVEVDPVGARVAAALGPAPGLPEEAFDTDGQLTKRDVRASALAHLRPWRRAVLWDLGAGSGTVGLEWARCAEGARAVLVERDPVRANRIRCSGSRLGVAGSIEVVEGDVVEAAASDRLPDPDAVFIGGGLSAALVESCWARLPVGGRLVAHAVTLGSEALLREAHSRHGGWLTRISVEHALPLGRHLSWTPARPVVQWSVMKDGDGRHGAPSAHAARSSSPPQSPSVTSAQDDAGAPPAEGAP